MHIAEGFLPPGWAAFWYAFSLPVVAYGAYKAKKRIDEDPKSKSLLAVAGAFIFVLSALKIPSVITGSCSHPTGTGIAVVLFGPVITAFLSILALLYQALLLAHGGITTLGANTASMGIVGPFVGWLAYSAVRNRIDVKIATFVAAAIADWVTYVVTSFQLALAFPSGVGLAGVMASATKFMAIFAVTQVPLAVIEGVVAALLIGYLIQVREDVVAGVTA
jgi:cobalt/nickel transport system permease protein